MCEKTTKKKHGQTTTQPISPHGIKRSLDRFRFKLSAVSLTCIEVNNKDVPILVADSPFCPNGVSNPQIFGELRLCFGAG